MGNLKCCPKCGSENVTDEQHGGSVLVTCNDCGFTIGPYALLWQAIEKWNEIDRSEIMPAPVTDKKVQSGILMIPLENLHNHPKNVRKQYAGIEELAASIKKHGIMQNLTVVPDPDSDVDYFVVIGNRRLQAARIAGLEEAPCAVAWDMSDLEQQTIMLTENMQRKDLTALEESDGMQMCLDLGMSEKELQEKTGLSKTTIRHRLKMRDLDRDSVEKACNEGATIFDFIKLEQIKDVNRRNEVLQYIGTSNFDYHLQTALTKEKNSAAFAMQIKKINKWADPVEKAPNGYAYYDTWFPPNGNIKVPETSEPGEYVYTRSEYSLTVYQKRQTETTDGDIMAAEREKQRKAVEDKQRWLAKRDELGKTLKACRMDFIKSAMRKPMKLDFFKYVGMSMLRYELDGTSGERFYATIYKPVFLELYGIESAAATYSFVADKLRQDPQKTVENLLYCSLETYQELPTVTSDRKWMHDAKFAFMYRVLESMGYQMSDDEKALLDGTHEIYEGNQNESKRSG